MKYKKGCHVIAIMMALFLWFQGTFGTIGFTEQALDLGYPKDFVTKLSTLSKDERTRFLQKTPSLKLSPLFNLCLSDGKFNTQESDLIELVQNKYGKESISSKQAEFFVFLASLTNFKDFFAYDFDVKEIESIPLKKDILDLVTIELYQRNSNQLPILMYHAIDGLKVGITKAYFLNHLNLLYNAGFSTMKLGDYYKSDFSKVPNGRKPLIITFDDGWISQFSFLDPMGTKIDPNCAVGILEDFAKLNPLFGKNAVFFPYMSIIPFTFSYDTNSQSQLWKKKIAYLQKNDFEIGCHTYSHKDLSKISDQEAIKELNAFYNVLKNAQIKPTTESMFLAYPWGCLPKNKNLIKNYSYENNSFKIAFLAGKGFGKVPFSKNVDPYQLPRISGYDSVLIPSIQEKVFVKFGYKISLPKLFLLSDPLLKQWIEKKTIYKTKFLISEPKILFSICHP